MSELLDAAVRTCPARSLIEMRSGEEEHRIEDRALGGADHLAQRATRRRELVRCGVDVRPQLLDGIGGIPPLLNLMQSLAIVIQ